MDVSRLAKFAASIAVVLTLSACSDNKKGPWEDPNARGQAVCNEKRIMNQFIVTWKDGRVTFHKDKSDVDFDNGFVSENLDQIQAIEYDRIIEVHAQESTLATSSNLETWGQDISQVSSVWAEGVLGDTIIVGVVDTGVDVNHSQLAGRVLTGYNFYDGTEDQNLDADEDHGTHVSGIIAASHVANSDVKGMAPKARIVPSKFLGGPMGQGSTAGAIAATEFAVSRGAKIINASWGGNKCSNSLEAMFKKVSDQGILLMTAAGNDGQDLASRPDYPAIYSMPHQITVGAIRSDGAMWGLSNHSYIYANIVAPGVSILSLRPNNSTRYLDGTSMATPFVSGAAALLWSAKPNATAAQIRQAILAGVDTGPYRVSTQGRLNVRKALDALRSLLP